MATTSGPTNKTLVVVGSGADTAIGNLIYMLGGVDLQTLAKLQEKSIDSYEKAAQELKGRNEELYFYTPRHRVTIKDRVPSADGLLLVVTPPLQEADAFFTKNFIDEIKGSESLFQKQKAIVLVKIPENHDWSESVYNELARSVRTALHSLGISAESIPIVPSNLQGENFIEPSPKTSWYTNVTLVTGLDKILS